MKRTEMINALETEYRDFLDQIDLNALLDFLVSKGMQPPQYEKVQYIRTGKGVARMKIKVNEWEPEEAP
jgi:hypothetical protein